MLRVRTRRPVGHIPPCLPSRAERPPSGPKWLHEIKHDGFRIMARRNGDRVRLYTRNGYDFAGRFPQIVEAVSKLKVRSCFIDGEVIVVDERGLSAFDLLRSWRHDGAAVLCAFDLIELDGTDLRSTPIEQRKRALAGLLWLERGGSQRISPSSWSCSIHRSKRHGDKRALRSAVKTKAPASGRGQVAGALSNRGHWRLFCREGEPGRLRLFALLFSFTGRSTLIDAHLPHVSRNPAGATVNATPFCTASATLSRSRKNASDKAHCNGC
jgi:hypothetical protein